MLKMVLSSAALLQPLFSADTAEPQDRPVSNSRHRNDGRVINRRYTSLNKKAAPWAASVVLKLLDLHFPHLKTR
ncbi:MAG: hypothetical protein BGO65_11395 [Afipia sp. 64-13]|nr:MAG: hypothetical protein BGO65_11395 [Afipia sp. 64-13]